MTLFLKITRPSCFLNQHFGQVSKSLIVVSFLGLLSACGGGGGSSEPFNDVPIAYPDAFSVMQNDTLDTTVAANDKLSVDGGNRWQLNTEPQHGELIFETDGTFSYTPSENYVGTDGFRYQLIDANGDYSAIVSVSITVFSNTFLSDPLISYQWYLENTRQTSLEGTLNVAGADIGTINPGSNLYAGGFTGQRIQLAILDEGLEIAHEDLSPNVVPNGSYNFLYPNNGKGQLDPTSTATKGDHGTSVAGLTGARGGNGVGIWGVAPSVELKGFNFLASQEFDEELAALGFKEAADQFLGLTSTQVDVFNKSYGRNPELVPEGSELAYYQTIIDAMEWGTQNLRSGKGALYVKAGGNEFKNGSVSCAKGMTCFNVNMETEHATPYQMVVGAFNANDVRASYSNTGSALWLVAPSGDDNLPKILTTDQSNCSIGYSASNTTYSSLNFDKGVDGTGNESCDYFSRFNGTSASTPMVSGAAALLLEANPELTWRDVKHILATTARPLDSGLTPKTMDVAETSVILESGWVENDAGIKYSNAYGFGAVNVDAAITKALNDYASLPAIQTVSTGKMTLSSGNEIADFNATGLSQTKAISQAYTTESVVLTLSIVGQDSNPEDSAAHNIDISDYQILLTSPNGTQSILLTPFNSYLPHFDMNDLSLISHAFYGEAMNGDWKVTVRDLDNTKIGTTNGTGLGKLVDWSLKLYGRQP